MNKKHFSVPVIMQGEPGDDIVIGGGSGEGGSDAISAYNYHDWLNSIYAEDLIQDGEINEWDYVAWWENHNFSQEEWEILNPDMPWDEYFG